MKNYMKKILLSTTVMSSALLLNLGMVYAQIAPSATTTQYNENVQSKSAFAKERFQFRLRGIGVLPENGGDTTIGGTPNPSDAFVPEFDISYFFTDHIAAELILATSPHDLELKNSAIGTIDLGETWVLPPTLTLQYHFMPDNSFSPYLGAGVNYTLPYSEEKSANITKLELEGNFGVALQAGFDYWFTPHWGANVDVKKIWVDVDASVNNGAITGKAELDPWVVGTGISYRF
jgi:outer membrane protein